MFIRLYAYEQLADSITICTGKCSSFFFSQSGICISYAKAFVHLHLVLLFISSLPWFIHRNLNNHQWIFAKQKGLFKRYQLELYGLGPEFMLLKVSSSSLSTPCHCILSSRLRPSRHESTWWLSISQSLISFLEPSEYRLLFNWYSNQRLLPFMC